MKATKTRSLVSQIRPVVAAGLVAVTLAFLAAGCDDLLSVDDPQRYTSGDLDQALTAVAAGVEGDFHYAIDYLVVTTSLASDVYRHTGTWAGYEELDLGRFQYRNTPYISTLFDRLLRARWAAKDAKERFERVLEGEAASSPLMVQAQVVDGMADLLIGQNFCEAPAEPSGPAVSDMQILEQAISKLTEGLQLAENAGATQWAHTARAARARAHLLLGQYGQAAADAAAIPDGFNYVARHSTNSGRQNNWVVTVTTAGQNAQAGLREKWWDMVDDDARLLIDPWTGELDARVPIYKTGAVATNGFTQHVSQWKYQSRGDDIPLFHSEEMRLIQAEVHWREGDLDEAMGLMNEVRSRVGLSPLPETDDPVQVRDYLLHERFAQMFMEGQRMSDLHRFGVFGEMVVEREEAPGQNVFGSDRPVKFPVSTSEALNNPSMEDDVGQRCLPRAG